MESNNAEVPFEELMRKWSIIIIKDIFLGCKRFNDFLKMNQNISSKVLSDQLKRLEKYGYIEKKVVSTTPLKAEYYLTKKGQSLNKIIYEMILFARKYWISEEDCKKYENIDFKKIFKIS
jgi:DNA-binding HxlR family transcriptional regulator